MALPSGNQLKAGRALAGLEQKQLAQMAKINPATLWRMEDTGSKPTRALATNLERVIEVLRKHGVEITNDPPGVRLIPKTRKK